MARDSHPSLGPRIVLGLGVIVVGLLLTLDNLDVVEADELLIYWPVILIAIGLTRVVSRNPGEMVFAWGFIGVGSWILLFNLEIIDLEPWRFFWPIVLIVVGTSLTLGALRRHGGLVAEPGETVNAFACLGGVDRRNGSSNFRGGEVTALLGGCNIDLRQAEIAEGSPVLGVFAMWGGIEVRVPPGWRVDSRVVPFLGGFEDTTESPAEPDAPCLTMKGVVIMGGVDVKN